MNSKDTDYGQNAGDERHGEQHRNPHRLFFGRQHPMGPHLIGVGPQRLADACAERVGLDQKGCKRLHRLDVGAFGQPTQRIRPAAT